MRIRPLWVLGIAGALLVSACERQERQDKTVDVAMPQPQAVPTPPAAEPSPSFSVERIKRGGALYREHCLQCHGPEGQGHPDWQTPSDGTFIAAPPLDGSGKVWKRNKQGMVAIIKNGAMRNGVPAMPAWKDRLSDEEIDDIITWFQVLWPPELYQRWLKANAGTRSPTG